MPKANSTSKKKPLSKQLSKILSKAFVIIILISLVLGTLLPMFLQIFGNAQVSVVPKSDPNAEIPNAWNLFRLSAGETGQGQVEVANSQFDDVIVDIRANDATFTEDGFFTIKPNTEINEGVGNWLELNQGRQAIAGFDRVDLPFSVTVPEGTPDGEYAGGISATLIEDTTRDTVALEKRSGSRVYVLVGSDFNIQADAGDVRVIDPTANQFEEDLRIYPEIDRSNLSFLMNLKNEGNIYARMIANYELTLPNGEIQIGNFESSLPPDQQTYPMVINTQVLYPEGESKLKIDYRFAPQNDLLEDNEVDFDPELKTTEIGINLTKEDIQNLPDKTNITEEETTERSDTWFDILLDWGWIIPIVIGAAVVGGIGYVIYKKAIS